MIVIKKKILCTSTTCQRARYVTSDIDREKTYIPICNAILVISHTYVYIRLSVPLYLHEYLIATLFDSLPLS